MHGFVRIADPFELDEDDFLPCRPPKFDSLAAEIEPPNWALGAISKQGGKRHPKREIQSSYVSSYSPSGAITPWAPPMGPHGPTNAHNRREEWDRAMSQRRKKQAKHSQQQVSARKQVPGGNLIEDDYRFWKGFPIANSDKDLAECRWCYKLCKGRSSMQEHEKEHDCKAYLLALYRYAHKSSKQRYCFSCKKITSNRHWGFPICNDVTCFGRWKFTFPEKLAGFMQYREWASEAQMRDPKGGPYSAILAEELRKMPAQVAKTEEDADESMGDIWGTPC